MPPKLRSRNATKTTELKCHQNYGAQMPPKLRSSNATKTTWNATETMEQNLFGTLEHSRCLHTHTKQLESIDSLRLYCRCTDYNCSWKVFFFLFVVCVCFCFFQIDMPFLSIRIMLKWTDWPALFFFSLSLPEVCVCWGEGESTDSSFPTSTCCLLSHSSRELRCKPIVLQYRPCRYINSPLFCLTVLWLSGAIGYHYHCYHRDIHTEIFMR